MTELHVSYHSYTLHNKQSLCLSTLSHHYAYMNKIVRVAEMFTQPLKGGVWGQFNTMNQCYVLWKSMCTYINTVVYLVGKGSPPICGWRPFTNYQLTDVPGGHSWCFLYSASRSDNLWSTQQQTIKHESSIATNYYLHGYWKKASATEIPVVLPASVRKGYYN